MIAATRGSELALVQTRLVEEALAAKGVECRELVVKTEGDKDRSTPLSQMGGRGVFVSAVEDAVLFGKADIAVNSAKDMPSRLRPGMCIGAVLKREDPRDMIVTLKGEELLPGDTVGTSSPRRTSQLGDEYEYFPLRGNIATRLRAVSEGRCKAVVMAAAAAKRLGYFEDEDFCSKFDVRILSHEEMIPAAGQGIIAVECAVNSPLLPLLAEINDDETYVCLAAERHFMSVMNAGCHESAGAYARIEDGVVHMVGYWHGKICRAAEKSPILAAYRLAEVLR